MQKEDDRIKMPSEFRVSRRRFRSVPWSVVESGRGERRDVRFQSLLGPVVNITRSSSDEYEGADKVMRQRFFKGRRQQLETATELAPLMRAIEDDPRQYHRRMDWQVLSYNHRNHEAKVHMGFYGDCCNSGHILRIGLNLKVLPEFEDILEKASTNSWLNLDPRTYRRKNLPQFERALSTFVDLALPAPEY